MENWIEIIAVVAGVIGVAGSILPGLPGLPLSWIGILILYIWGSGVNSAGEPLSLTALIVWAVVVVAVTIMDYVVPPLITKKMGGSKYAEKGSLYGMIFGIIFTPVGMILGAFLGALLAELFVAKKREGELRMLTGHFFAKPSHLIDIRDCGTNKENCYIYPIG